INFVTKKPSNDYAARVSAEAGTDNFYELRGTIEGPLIRDVLTARVSARHYEFGGQYRSAVSGLPLGQQQTDNVSLALAATPSANVDMSLFYSYSRDNDSHTATAKILTFGTTPLLDCDLGGTSPYFGRRLTDLSEISPASSGDNIGATALLRAALVDNSLLDLDGFRLAPSLGHFGLKRDIHHVTGRIDVETDGGWQFSAVGSYTHTAL